MVTINAQWKHVAAVVVVLALAHGAAAQGRGNGNNPGRGNGNGANDAGEKNSGGRGPAGTPAKNKAAARAQAPFVIQRASQRGVITQYFTQQALPPGLAKREALPPGLAKQLRERGQLPPGLQKRFVEVPSSLNLRLQPLPASYHRYFVGRDLIVVDTPGNRIVALLRDVLR